MERACCWIGGCGFQCWIYLSKLAEMTCACHQEIVPHWTSLSVPRWRSSPDGFTRHVWAIESCTWSLRLLEYLIESSLRTHAHVLEIYFCCEIMQVPPIPGPSHSCDFTFLYFALSYLPNSSNRWTLDSNTNVGMTEMNLIEKLISWW